MGQIQSLDEFLSLLWRRRWLIIAVTLLGLALAAVYAKSRPATYSAAAVIQIEVPSVTEQDGTVAPSGAAQLLQAIEQRLTTRENLLAVIARHGLYANLPGLTDDQKVQALRSALTFQSVASATAQNFGAPPAISAIIIFARMDSPALAARVANDFAQGILDQSTAGQLESARDTTTFFATEEARVWQQIVALEAEIAAFKNANAAAMPTRLSVQSDELVALDADLRDLAQSRVAIEGQRSALGPLSGLRATQLRTLDALDAQLTVLDAQSASLLTRRAEIEAALAGTPEVDRVLSGYDRRLAQLQGQHDVVTRRMAEAETSQRLAEARQSERFILLERATEPQFATGGGGKKLVLAGGIVSLLAGIALAFVLDLVNPVIRTAEQMQRQLDLRPVVSIPEISPQSRRKSVPSDRIHDDPTPQVFGLPRYAVVVGGVTIALMLATAVLT